VTVKEISKFLEAKRGGYEFPFGETIDNEEIKEICRKLNISVNDLIYEIVYMLITDEKKYRELLNMYKQELSKRQALEKIVNDSITDGKLRQNKKVAAGIKMNEKKVNIYDAGYSNEQIMDIFDISRATLWRYKKALEADSLFN
jgi:arsenate reductase-like glutaredoxin family protein